MRQFHLHPVHGSILNGPCTFHGHMASFCRPPCDLSGSVAVHSSLRYMVNFAVPDPVGLSQNMAASARCPGRNHLLVLTAQFHLDFYAVAPLYLHGVNGVASLTGVHHNIPHVSAYITYPSAVCRNGKYQRLHHFITVWSALFQQYIGTACCQTLHHVSFLRTCCPQSCGHLVVIHIISLLIPPPCTVYCQFCSLYPLIRRAEILLSHKNLCPAVYHRDTCFCFLSVFPRLSLTVGFKPERMNLQIRCIAVWRRHLSEAVSVRKDVSVLVWLPHRQILHLNLSILIADCPHKNRNPFKASVSRKFKHRPLKQTAAFVGLQYLQTAFHRLIPRPDQLNLFILTEYNPNRLNPCIVIGAL